MWSRLSSVFLFVMYSFSFSSLSLSLSLTWFSMLRANVSTIDNSIHALREKCDVFIRRKPSDWFYQCLDIFLTSWRWLLRSSSTIWTCAYNNVCIDDRFSSQLFPSNQLISRSASFSRYWKYIEENKRAISFLSLTVAGWTMCLVRL